MYMYTCVHKLMYIYILARYIAASAACLTKDKKTQI
jgi:hypothetical protein